ncbi:uncharacterized protein (DUF885 family) [Herbihabitans rhizosphaerae]|uniref:Uncharacterized protein (DUF885 family) n=1 Tax=Herbihabitans rhizosphaerae TaxID=1872711 RepID=A0A4Q7L5S1_9PSEU|nr:DUF885 domain-containing protein [Herbihabitans rhizosphaerae]RZS44999.1 uncharacterized protein (DUF885 family) [Herbihabitans rhizosphaerae]
MNADPATSVQTIADELLRALLEAEPLEASLLGLPGYEGLGDPSEEGDAASRARVTDIAARLDAVDRAGVHGEDLVTLDVAKQQADAFLSALDSRQVEYTITDLFVAPASGLLTALPMLSLDGRGESYVERLRAIPAFLGAIAERHRVGLRAGRLPVAHLVTNAVAHLDRYLADPDADPLRRPTPPDGAEAFAVERDALLEAVVRPAFTAYRQVLATEVNGHARDAEKVGLCWLPDGEASYASLSEFHTTTARTPEDLHQTGLDLLDALTGEYAEIGQRVFGTSDRQQVFQRLRTDPAMRWRDADELLDAARTAVARAERVAPEWFGRLPSSPCVVEAVPAAQAPGAPMAYYMRPSADGTRAGTYFANTHDAEQRDRYLAEVTAFHEAVPGHHFQISIAQELAELPDLRRYVIVNAYAEGWGLYTERLAERMGLYTDDVARLGMLAMDSVRASRLVVDTGMHVKGWSRERAIDFMIENVPMARQDIVVEIDRYIAYPGQALSYMVGRLEFERLRDRARASLGDAFDIREFHDLVLGGGALPMTVLDDVVARWESR